VEHKLELCGPALRMVGELISEVFLSPFVKKSQFNMFKHTK